MKIIEEGGPMNRRTTALYDVKTEGKELRENFKELAKKLNKGVWIGRTETIREICLEILNDKEISESFEYDSEEYYAQQTLLWLKRADKEISEDNAKLSAKHAFEAGITWATAIAKFEWEAHVIGYEKLRKSQTIKAKKSRSSGKDVDGKKFSLTEEIRNIAKYHPDSYKAKDLWNHFISALDIRGMNPKEYIEINSRSEKINFITYSVEATLKNPSGIEKTSINTFRTTLNRVRKNTT